MLNSSQRAAVNPSVDQLITTILMQLRIAFTTPFTKTTDKTTINQVRCGTAPVDGFVNVFMWMYVISCRISASVLPRVCILCLRSLL